MPSIERWPAAPSTTQAVGSSTFTPPPFDGSLTLHEIYDFHLKNSPTHPLFIWDSGPLGLRRLTWGEVARGSHRAAHYVKKHTHTHVGDGPPPVVAILAFADTVTFVCLILGLIRAGFQCFCISPRNSAAGVHYLLESVGASEIIVQREGNLKALCTAAIAELKNPVHVLPLPEFGDFFAEDLPDFQPFLSPPFIGLDTPAIIMHSSGSTSFPKPRTFTHRTLIQQSHVPWFGQADLCNEILATHALPLFHAQGLFNSILPLSTGMILSIFPPDLPTSLPTPEKLIHGIAATASTILITVPTFLEHWAQIPENVEILSKLKAIFCGGAPLNKDSSNIYRENGVPILCYLAATEYGIATPIVPKQPPSEGSEWFAISSHLSPVFLPQDEHDVFELVFVASPIHSPSVINIKVDGRDAYATGDLVIRHPLNHNLWRVHGRIDDQIMLSTGEKTNPGPIETIITCSPYVKNCVMFGRGRFQSGVIIEPLKPFDPSNIQALSSFRNDIWSAVEEANRFAPSHSRIFKEMIIVSHPSKPFEVTLKNTTKRQLVIATYQQEIDATYAAVAESAQEELSPPSVWNPEETLDFIRKVVLGVLVSSLRDDDDLFSQGADSLQATWIRNSILRALRESSKIAIAKQLPGNFVYEHPSVAGLTHYLVDMVAGRESAREPAISDMSLKLKQMEDLVVKYSRNFPARTVSAGELSDEVSGEVVVLTGSTGSLGCQILASLIQDPAVSRIYALNRRRTVSVVRRQAMMWNDHDLDPLLLSSDKVAFVEVNATEGLGIPQNVTNEIRASATLIIHNAWIVDFKLALQSFEPNIRTMRALMDLALQSPRSRPPRFVFTSTVGVLRRWKGPNAVAEAPLHNMAFSLGVGYTESKCVAERILESHNTALRILVVRVGQLAGAPNGSWRTTEWVPALVKSGTTLGVLPDVAGAVSWIPLHAAALGLLEVARTEANTPGTTFVHLVHPSPVPWKAIFHPLSEALGVPLVPYDEWLERLQQLVASGDNSSAARLLSFFTAVKRDGGCGGDAMGFPTLESKETQKKAPKSLGALDALGQADVHRWIRHWRRKRFL